MPPKGPRDNVVQFRRPPAPRGSVRFPRWLPEWLFTTATGWIILANVLVYVVMVVLARGGGIVTEFPWGLSTVFGANIPPLVVSEPWRLVTAAFMHANAMHIGMNMLFFWYFGRQLEDALGKGRFLTLYMVSAIGASLVSAGWHAWRGGSSVGASGAIMGVLGGLLTLSWRGLGRHHPVTKMFLQYALIGFALGIVESLLGTDALDNAAHIGGWVTGLAITMLFVGRRPWARLADWASAGVSGALVAGSFALALTVGSARLASARPSDLDVQRNDAIAAYARSDWPAAERAVSRLIEETGDGVGLRVLHADILQKMGRKGEARSELVAAMKLDGTPDEFANLAMKLEEVGELDLARKAAATAKFRSGGNPKYDRLYQEIKAKSSGSGPAPAATPSPAR